MTRARALTVAVATSCVVLTATASAGTAAAPTSGRVDGVIARVADADCMHAPSARLFVDPDCGRLYVAFGGALVSTQPSWLSLRGVLDRDGHGGTVEGDQGFTGCLGQRCGTLRLTIHGRFSYARRSGDPIVDGVARIRRATGGLAGLEGALSFHLGRSGAYSGVLHLPSARP